MNGYKILVVDDEPDVLRMLQVVLERGGHQVLAAPSGLEGLVTAQGERPDLILLDVMMEGMDGWEVLKLLKLDPATHDIPVVMVSARTEPRDKIRGLQEGAVDYVAKPFSVRELVHTIEAILEPPPPASGAGS
ncbi:MAG TPA: response regulator [Thermoanaerobaculia bacterium]|jgi:DNA-binding response OmpR family regulator|nr:response regulator [Thermoanaerobaculia bacterium]